MKLSKKGAEKISTNCKNVTVIGTDDFFPPTILEGADKLEFEQSDFTGMVVLTVEEAKQALGCIAMSRAIADDIEGKDRELQLKLQERIEEAQENV